MDSYLQNIGGSGYGGGQRKNNSNGGQQNFQGGQRGFNGQQRNNNNNFQGNNFQGGSNYEGQSYSQSNEHNGSFSNRGRGRGRGRGNFHNSQQEYYGNAGPNDSFNSGPSNQSFQDQQFNQPNQQYNNRANFQGNYQRNNYQNGSQDSFRGGQRGGFNNRGDGGSQRGGFNNQNRGNFQGQQRNFQSEIIMDQQNNNQFRQAPNSNITVDPNYMEDDSYIQGSIDNYQAPRQQYPQENRQNYQQPQQNSQRFNEQNNQQGRPNFDRGPRNNYQQNNNRSFDRPDRNNNSNRGGNFQRRPYRDTFHQNQRQMTEQDLFLKLREKRNVLIENHHQINLPHNFNVDNASSPYILPSKNRANYQQIDPSFVTITGARKLTVPNNPYQVQEFFDFPELPNKGEVNREQVQGFRDVTQINYADFQRRGGELMEEILRSFERTFR